MVSEYTHHQPAEQAVTIYQPTLLTPLPAAPTVPAVIPGHAPAVQSVQLPDGRIVTGYALAPHTPAPVASPAVSRTAVNLALGGVGFAAVCGGLLILTSFIAALAAFVHQLIILAAVIFGGSVAIRILGPSHGTGGTVINIGRAIFKRNKFYG
ncbi:hypothetical protein [Streptomyces sp. H39-S7]|uniref:hypothetical protein n=1 Tax=Streptomyces sp. H39-S7 TaxID=3004357 RepID=UPI0022AF9A03|nr:hypothetical protein [Streptomyces sp. H39-S7]MCZ4122612.1 hypothetical protein [Streptomyces sp. H39-S7]